MNFKSSFLFLLLASSILMGGNPSLHAGIDDDKSASSSAARQQFHGIEIPSKYDEVGLPPAKQTPAQFKSWDDLRGFTAQTLSNFQKGERRGIFIGHSIEFIMGAIPTFIYHWNQNHPEDQRSLKPKQDVFEVFTPEEFVNHYVDYVLAKRVWIAGSVFALNQDNKAISVLQAFSPYGFIFEVPAECIAGASVRDVYSAVVYHRDGCLKGYKNDIVDLNHLKSRAQDNKTHSQSSLDTLVHFPGIDTIYEDEIDDCSSDSEDSDSEREPAPKKVLGYKLTMNEAVISSCVQGLNGAFHRPRVVGVFENNVSTSNVSCSGNSALSRKLKDVLLNYGESHKLPVIKIDELDLTLMDTQQMETKISEWFNGDNTFEFGPLFEYTQPDVRFEGDFANKAKNFLMSDEQLAGYGVSRN